jgi:hypothetical protein
MFMFGFMVLSSGVFAAATDIQFYGYTWFRETGNNKVFDDGQTNTAKPTIERTYLRWKLKYEDNLEGNITLDIPMKSGNTTNSDWNTLVKYAYVDLKNTLPDDGFVRIGVQPVYFAMLDKWEYPMVYKPLEDNLGLLSSADLGVSLQGTLFGGLADYQVAGFGANGYAKPTETDNNTATDISVAVYPIPGLSIRGSLYNATVSSGDAYAKEGVSAGKWYNGVAANYYWGPLWFMWEGVEGMKPNSKMDDSFKVSGNSKMVMWTVNDKWDIGVREDIYNPDVNNDSAAGTDNTSNSAQDFMIYGVNYHWADDLLIQLNSSKLTYDGGNQNAGANPYSPSPSTARYTQYETILQVKWSF